MENLEKTMVWFSIANGGDGSAYPRWYLSSDEAEYDQENMDEGWGEPCTGSVETFIGSDIYNDSVANRVEQETNKIASNYYNDFWLNITGNSVKVYGYEPKLSNEDKDFLKEDFKKYNPELIVSFN